jgi:sec-independent protein translocase protein TatC
VAARKAGRSADDAARMPLMEHIRELRGRIVKAAFAIIIGVVIAFIYRNHVISLLENQVCDNRGIDGIGKPTAQCPNGVLTLSGPTAGITLAFKVAVFGGAFLAAPIWLYQFWAFLAPGLYKKEKRYGLGFIAVAVPLFALGATMCYYYFPKIMGVLLGRGFTPAGVAVQLPVDTFLTFYLRMMAVFGISFVLPLFLVLFNFLGIMSSQRMLKHWRGIVLVIFVFAAIAVPTGDPIGMTVLATPICVLYFAAVGVSRMNDARRARRRAADPNTQLGPDEASSLDLSPGRIDDAAPVEEAAQVGGPSDYDDIS